MIAESVNTFGIESSNLPPDVPVDGYLRLYEAMISGVIEYEVCFVVLPLAPFVHFFVI